MDKMSKVTSSELRRTNCSKIQPPRKRSNDDHEFMCSGSSNEARRKETNISHQENLVPTKADPNKTTPVPMDEANSSNQSNENSKLKFFNYRHGLGLMLPKINIKVDSLGDRLVQNPRILDLRNKLNEINKKRERDVDKETKTLINDITQQLVEENPETSDSGPYSLLLDLHDNGSSSKKVTNEANLQTWSNKNDIFISPSTCKSQNNEECHTKVIQDSPAIHINRSPNVLTFEGKQLNEYEYSCESYESHKEHSLRKPIYDNPRSDLRLNFKTQTSKQPQLDTLSPTTDSSLCKPNEENSLDDSLGILTPDQMDDMCYLENTFSPTVEGLPIFYDESIQKTSSDNGETPSTDKTDSNSAASTMFLENDNNGITNDVDLKSQEASQSFNAIKVYESENGKNVPSLRSNLVDLDVTMTPLDENKAINQDTSNGLQSQQCNDYLKENSYMSHTTEDELLPSIHSSILEPISSIVDTTVNLDLPLDSKHFENPTTNKSIQRIDLTPSPEDLPLDPSDLNEEYNVYSSSQVSSATLHDCQTYSEPKTDFPKSMETSKVSNSFITSITSITSLDGYQGDGEMSRPVSRGADQSLGNREDVVEMDWQNVPVNRRPDPMTDSDFFTESDADGLDENVHRGDRRAQVIDGALYGGKNSNGNAPLIVTRNDDSCMESSGVYTDLENHRSSPVFLNAIEDMSPDGSSPSTRSECSQKNSVPDQNGLFESLDDTLVAITKSRLSLLNDDVNIVNAENGRNSLHKGMMKESKCNDKISKEEKRSFALKKYKMPKRDVPSKLKTMLASRKVDVEGSIENSPSNKMSKKNERRESSSKKGNTNDKTEYKFKSYKDVKPKVDSTFSLQRSQTACSVTRMLSAKSTATNTKSKSRHMRSRLSELGSVTVSGKSSLHSSQSDISATSTPLGKHAPSRFPLTSH